jgi:DNA-binding CsgD family transcriptional regulator
MKGMAIYSDDIPEGYDIVYNTNKASGTPAEKVFKTMNKDANGNIDADNPFGALIKGPKEKDGVLSAGGQSYYTDVNGKTQLSPVNKLREEGDWDSWSRTLSSQFLAKQPLKLINQQINISIADKKAELEKINNLTNPVIKKKLLEDFANGCDANASDLSVKGFKNQAFQVLLPVSSMKDNEIYAPNYNDGDTVALVRYPHGGIFEIPVLKVNNKQADAKKIMENASDAVGINTKVAEQLSGADFDGDTALVIPIKSNRLNIASSKQLEGLKDFDPKESYKLPDDAPKMKSKTKQNEMGRVSNLITDMTVGGASPKEIEKAVKHSMVVIDAEKHHLDYKQSAKDNDIQSLKKKYQGVNEETGMVKGASTILSKAGAEVRINQRKEVQDTSKMTDVELERWNNGQKVYRDTGATKTILVTDTSKMTPSELALHQAGKKVYRDSGEYKQEKVSRMDTVDDAMDLVRDPSNQKEVAYAKYANTLKGLANEARKEARSIKPTPVSQSAKSTYANEVASLNAKLRVSQMNAPRERQAQTIANAMTSEKLKSNPDMDYEHRQREKSLALNKARAQVGAGKEKITITDKEWEAIQANAISTNKLTQILNNTDQEAFKQRATPKGSSTALTNAQLNLILAMSSSGMYTQKEIADRLGVSTSTVSKVIREN